MHEKKTVLITGSRRGFGRATAIALANKGYHVIATTHHQKDADEFNNFANEKGLNIRSFKLDINQASDRELIDNYDIDVLINNAAIGESGSLAEIPLDRLRNNLETNVISTLALSQLALKKMIEKGSGRIIFISSLAGRAVSMPFLGAYTMSKYALSAGAESLRNEIKVLKKDIYISVVEPGAYHTGFNQDNIAKKYVWMDENSLFYNMIPSIKKREEWQFKLTEQKDLSSLVKKIIKAVEEKKPRFRYTAPWWQSLGIRLLRIFGK